ncbi:MAG TPA: amino acid adenylation domain-containing protein, partial [Longimicrobium sp.]|nr:amino acid adenylation domain-containing protein [Longimicrobium sp.]
MNRKELEAVYPLSPLQQGMLFHTLYAPEAGAYAEQMVLRLRGPVRPDALEHAWRRMVERHDVLRTAFVWEGVPAPVQAVLRAAELPFHFHDLAGTADAGARLDALIREDAARPFALNRAPLLRVTLARMSDDDHRMVVSMHHGTLDGWSLAILLGELLRAYAALLDGVEPDLPPRRPFREYIAWLKKRDPAASETFWRMRLAGFREPTPLPLDAAPGRAGRAPERYGRADHLVPPTLAEALRSEARRRRVTLNTLLHGAWAALLSRWTGVEDVVFATTVAGRPPELPGADGMVGMFLNTIPVRVAVDESPLDAWLEAIRDRAGEATLHEHTPLADVRGWTELPPGRPLFETLFVLENHPAEDPRAGIPDDPRLPEIVGGEVGQRTNFALAVTATPMVDGLRLTATSDAARLDDASIARLLAGYETILRQIVDGTARTAADLDPLTGDEVAQIVGSANHPVDYPRDLSIHRLFERVAGEFRDSIVLRWERGTLSYGDLNARANRLARRLRAFGVDPDSRVGVAMERSPELIVVLLAIVKAGGAYVPLDPDYPAARLDFMRRDAGVSVVIVAGDGISVDGFGGARVLSLAAEREAIDYEAEFDLEIDGDPLALAYLVYTSGSTGTPTGTAVPHRAVVRLVRGQSYACFGPGEVFLQLAPVAFDASTWEIWGTLLNGGALAIHPAGLADTRKLGEFVDGHGVTAAWLTAGLFHQVIDGGAEGFGGVRRLLAGGDVLSPAHVWRAGELLPRTVLVNGYGPTEATTFTCCHEIRPDDAGAGSIPIGRPLANTHVYVLDARMRLVPPGAPGELYVGGDGLGRGYLGRAAQTAAAWLPDPFGPEPGARLYRTGDRVRWNARGELEFLGRIDQQVKIRGFRVEPGEVEAVLAAHPFLARAVVEARDGATGGKRLVAYVVPSSENVMVSGDGDDATALEDVDAVRVREWLRERLPEHLVPSAVVMLDALPLTPNGKVDRRALPDPELAELEDEDTPPLTQTEELLAGVWREVLGSTRVDPGDDFFALGGQSLLAMRLSARARAVFGAEVPVRTVFDAPVLRAMAARIDKLRGGTDHVLPLLPRGDDGPAPLSFGQERIWLTDRLSGGRMAYVVTAVHDFPADADEGVIARALTEIVRRHDVLRTVFRAEDGGAMQIVLAPSPVPFSALDLRGVPATEREDAVDAAFAEEGAAAFDLERGPLLRARLLRLPEAARLVVSMHHAVSDGWSVGVLHRELRVLYDAFSRGAPSPLAEPPVRYADWSAWQRRMHAEGGLAAQAEFWRRTLADAPAAIDLPADRPRPAARGFAGAHQWVRVPAATARAARTLAEREGATLFMVLLAAFDVLLARTSGSDDIVVGTPVAGRTRPETESLIGFFVNNLPIRADLSGEPSFREVIGRVRKAALDAYAHQDLPFQLLVEAAGAEPTLRYSPVFQVLFALQPRGAEDSPAAEEDENEPLPAEPVPGAVEYELALDVRETGEALLVRCSYSTERFEHATARRLAERWARVLEVVLADPAASIHAHDLADEEERRSRARALELGDAVAAYPTGGTLHARFAAQAARTPDAPALRFEGETLTYGELDARANQLANHLRILGVGPESLVGLCVERSPETVIGILAILKAGGAYLPLDPAYPAERLAYMLDDSRAVLVVTTAALAPNLPATVRTIRIDTDPEVGARPTTVPGVELSADALAYVIYTSGSTGRPKGVQVTHGNVMRLFDATERTFSFDAGDVWTLFHSYAFDFSVWEMWGALLFGGRLVIVPFYLSRTPEAFLRLLAEERVTVLNQTPSAFRQLIHADEDASANFALRWVIFGGEALDPTTLAPWVERRGIETPRLVNMYGITETTVHVTFRPVTEDDVRGGASAPVGAPLADLSVRVLDARGEPVPLGATGEMHVGGAGVARGYLGRPALTAERFVPDPFSRVPGMRLYRSGDLACWDASGGLEYLGRIDDQVKVRGFRIELGEIESVLRQHANVRDAVVLPRGEGDAKRLVAWIAADGEAPSTAELRAHATARLPEYMVPSAFVTLDALPLTRNGKVDRRALPEPAGEGA